MIAYMSARTLDGLLELVEELGGSGARLIGETGVSRALFTDDNGLIPYTLYCQLIENAVKQLGRPDFALLLARRRMESNYAKEIKIYVFSAQRLQQAIEGMIDHLRTRTLGIDYALEVDRDIACFSRTPPPRDAGRYPQATILLMASFYLLLFEASGSKLQLTSVSFASKDPGTVANLLRAFFRCPVQFEAEFDSLNFEARFLGLDISTQDDSLHDLLTDYLKTRHLEQTRDFADLVRSLIRKNLAAGRPDIEALSLRIPFQSRTIQKKLKEAGTSFTELLNEVRFELAESLLQSDIPITYIGQRLCYQDISAFSKAFSKRYGVSPRQWKSGRKQGDPSS